MLTTPNPGTAPHGNQFRHTPRDFVSRQERQERQGSKSTALATTQIRCCDPLSPAAANRLAGRRHQWLAAAPLVLGLAVWLAAAGVRAGEPDAVTRGEYVFRAAAGCSCHTDFPNDGPALAGGRAIDTPFGTFYSPNITPDPDTGIGDWSEEDFVRAMTEGVGPSGKHYYPVFPYTSYARMTREDLSDLWAYLSSREPVSRRNRAHDLWWPVRWRYLLSWWKWWYLDDTGRVSGPARSETWNRGAYLVNGPSHCGECHTPRDLAGGRDRSMMLAGTADGPEGELAPNITPAPETGIGKWHPADLTWLLQTGLLPDGDGVQGTMAEAIDEGYSHLTAEDRDAIAEYIMSLPPIEHDVE